MTAMRRVVCVALILYCCGIVLLAAFPSDGVTWAEWVCVALAGTAAVGLGALCFENVVVPGERYAYLVAGLAGLVTMFLYLLDPNNHDPVHDQARIAFLLMSGVVGSYGAFWVMEGQGPDGP